MQEQIILKVSNSEILFLFATHYHILLLSYMKIFPTIKSNGVSMKYVLYEMQKLIKKGHYNHYWKIIEPNHAYLIK